MTTTSSSVLVDAIVAPSVRSRTIARDAALVVGFALFTALAAQITIHLGFTPVPITGQTFAVLLSGSVLGWRRGALSQGVYWAMGLVGLPFYSGGDGGWSAGTGSTMGYLVGFIAAAALIGYVSQRQGNRNYASSFSAMAMGTVVIYVFGAGWLAHNLHIPVATGDKNAIGYGVTPFLIGDLLKMLVAGAIAPTAWAVLGRDKK
ncbi:MAG: biotin transporter BioY [Ilumatobacteraceae bacterium]|nr:biotin transporter BioY [Ilumatobacteraceae bacterium]